MGLLLSCLREQFWFPQTDILQRLHADSELKIPIVTPCQLCEKQSWIDGTHMYLLYS